MLVKAGSMLRAISMLPSMVRAVAFLLLTSYFIIGLSQQGFKEHLANKVDCTKG